MLHDTHTTTCDNGGRPSLRSIPPARSISWCHIYHVLPTANTAKAWGSIALLILEMYHRVQTGDYTALLTYRYRFLYTIRDNLAGPIPAPHTIRFVVRSDELLNSKYGRSATGAERPILIPSTTVAQAFGSMSPENRNKPNYRCN